MNRHEEMPDTTVDIWERTFRCRFSRNLTTSAFYQKKIGTNVTGDADYDKTHRDELVDTNITIDYMVDLHRRGIPIYVVKYEDTEKIYQIVERHILAWKHRFEHGVNLGSAPIDDLIAMDAFAAAVYDKAKYLTDSRSASSAAIHYLTSFSTLSRGGLSIPKFTAPKTEEEIQQNEDEKYPPRPSQAPTFRSMAVGFGRRWK